jgi:hypothetical protein
MEKAGSVKGMIVSGIKRKKSVVPIPLTIIPARSRGVTMYQGSPNFQKKALAKCRQAGQDRCVAVVFGSFAVF